MAVLCLSRTIEGDGEGGGRWERRMERDGRGKEGRGEKDGERGEERVCVKKKRERSLAARGDNLNLNSYLAKTLL